MVIDEAESFQYACLGNGHHRVSYHPGYPFILHVRGSHLLHGRYAEIARAFIFLWPALFLAEAVVYRIIRKRITRRNMARWHVLLTFFSAVILRWIYYVRVIMHSGIALTLATIILYILCMIVGHIFFITIITEAWSRKNFASDNEDKNVNLLDDIVNE